MARVITLLGIPIVPLSGDGSFKSEGWDDDPPCRAMLSFGFRFEAPGYHARRRVITGYWRSQTSRLVRVVPLS